MNQRRLCNALDHRAVRELNEAVHFAEKRGKPLNTTITIHPKLLDDYPADLGRWVSDFTNKLRILCQRAGFDYFAVWVRENYEGDRREHLHLMLYVPEREKAALEESVRRWLPGRDEVVKLREPEFRKDRYGRHTNKALTYMLKQMTPQAWFALKGRVFREKKCRETHAPVAPVLGRRFGISRSLNRNTRAAFWTRPATTPARNSVAA
jgi:hypothetical protein